MRDKVTSCAGAIIWRASTSWARIKRTQSSMISSSPGSTKTSTWWAAAACLRSGPPTSRSRSRRFVSAAPMPFSSNSTKSQPHTSWEITMSTHSIETKQELYHYLAVAMQLEHATIPPYLTALYTIKPGTNRDASMIIREVVVEEMLHLTLAANVLNAVGGKPDLTVPGFVPTYPALLPDGEEDFEVSLRPFSQEALQTFLKIERPAPPAPIAADGTGPRKVKRARPLALALNHPDNTEWSYYSIGEFYKAIQEGIKHLSEKMPATELFNGDPR